MGNPSQKLGERIKELRLKLNLTQSQLAGDSFTKSFISQVEKGLTNPSIRSLNVIAQRLGVPVSYFVSESAAPSEDLSTEHHIYLENAKRELEAKRLPEAFRLFEKALSRIPPSHHGLIGAVHIELADIYAEQDHDQKAIAELRLAVEHLRLAHDSYALARALNMLGYHQTIINQHIEATNSYQAGLNALSKSGADDEALRIRLLVNLGISYAHQREYIRCIDTLVKAIAIMRQTDNFYCYGKTAHTLGYAYAKAGNVAEAITYTRQAFELYKALGQQSLVDTAQINLAIFLRMSGNLSDAKDHLLHVISHADERHNAALAHAELAHVHFAQGDLEAAAQSVMTALDLDPNHHEAPEWIELLADIAQRQPFPADFVDQVAEKVSRWDTSSQGLAGIHSSLGSLYQLAGETVKANVHLSRSVDLFKQSV